MSGRESVAGFVVSAVLLLALAPSALGATFTVNDTTDLGDDDLTDLVCDTDTGTTGLQCSLRAAVEQGNFTSNPAPGDMVTFDPAFDGSFATSTITLGAPITISRSLIIEGGDCGTLVPMPCVGLRRGGPTEVALNVTGDDVQLNRLSISNAIAIGATALADRLAVRGSWLGIDLNGLADPVGDGVLLEGSSAATVGGATVADRNVFGAGTSGGVRILDGGDNNAVRGNYFGVAPDGSVPAGFGFATNIEVESKPGDVAVGTMIGAADSGTPTVCDAGCNVVSNAGGHGIDLGDGGDDAGQTTIAGNFIGLDPSGGGLGNAGDGVAVADATNVTLGGATAAQRNYIAGNGNAGIDADAGAAGLTIRHNFIGLSLSGSAAVANGFDGINSLADGAIIRDNRIAGDGVATDEGLHQLGANGTIAGNAFGVGTGGEDLGFGGDAVAINGAGNTFGDGGFLDGVDANVVGNADDAGVELAGSGNVVIGNLIGTDPEGVDHGNGDSGIEISGDGNVIGTGGSEASLQNTISNGADDAIAIIDNTADGNTVLRNRGRSNGGLFLDLGDNGFGNPGSGPNDDIEALTITSLDASSISGTGALANAAIRAFRTFTQNGDLRSFITETVDGDGGSWSVSFPVALPTGQCVTVAQTDTAGNTSEFPAALAVGGGACDVTPPAATIDSGPAGPTNDPTPTFEFSAGEPGSTFECRFDAQDFAPCSDPGEHTPGATLSEGAHAFEVRATDLVGNTGPADSQGFTVDTVGPQTAIASGPAGLTGDPTPSFAFSSPEVGATFQCRIDSLPFASCSGPGNAHTTGALLEGPHVFRVRAVDALGNPDPTPASRSFTVALTTCAGLAVTHLGTPGADSIAGTPGPDVIAGLGGRDVIRGLGSGDVLCGGAGRDRLIGGRGRDRLLGQRGKDVLVGGPGKDRLRGGGSKDTEKQ